MASAVTVLSNRNLASWLSSLFACAWQQQQQQVLGPSWPLLPCCLLSVLSDCGLHQPCTLSYITCFFTRSAGNFGPLSDAMHEVISEQCRAWDRNVQQMMAVQCAWWVCGHLCDFWPRGRM